MNLKLIKETEAPLLSRKRCTFEVEFSKKPTPSNQELKKTIAGLMEVNEDLIALRHIYQRFGINKAKVIAHIYKDAKILKDVEEIKKKKVKAKKTTQEKQAEVKPAEAAK